MVRYKVECVKVPRSKHLLALAVCWAANVAQAQTPAPASPVIAPVISSVTHAVSDTAAAVAAMPQKVMATLHPTGNDAALSGAAFTLTIDAPDDIRAVLQSHLELLRYRDLPDLDDGELTRLLDAAQADAQQLLATLGYFAPTLAFTRPAADAPAAAELATPAIATAPRHITLHVSPGEPTRVTQVEIQFAGALATDASQAALRAQIKTSWLLRQGQRFTQSDWDAAKQQLLRELTRKRYPSGQLQDSIADIDPDNHSARLTVLLDSGPAYQLGTLSITGLQRYDAALVTRLARLQSGEDYDQDRMLQAQQRLIDSGYFESAFIRLDTTSGNPTAAPVSLELREAKLQKLVLGVGGSTDSGARASVEHTHHLLPGLGWGSVTKLSADRDTQSLGVELTSPPDDKQWRWLTSALVKQEQVNSQPEQSLRWRWGRTQTGERIDRQIYLQYDRSRVTSTNVTTAEAVSANYAYTQRHFNDVLFPTRGYGLAVELGGGVTLGPMLPFTRLLGRWQGYVPLGDTAFAGRLAARAEAGAVLAQASAAIPSTQLFLTGGDNTVRGYGYHDLGVSKSGQIVAGRYLSVASLEWQHPLSRTGSWATWEAAMFIDAGSVADQTADLQAHVGVGSGLRWKSPVGPLQIDLAYGVTPRKMRLHLNMGFSF